MIQDYIFMVFVALTSIGALLVLLLRNILYAALSLFFAFLGIAAIYVFVSADFLAITQLVIYIGGILILVLFGIMLTNRVSSVKDLISESGNKVFGYLMGIGLFTLLCFGIKNINIPMYCVRTDHSIIRPIGISLMTDNILLFEVSAVLLLVVLVGAAYLISKQGANE